MIDDPEGTNAQLLANALTRAERAEARISSLQSSIRMAMDDVPGWYDSCRAALNLPDISAASDHASQKAASRAESSEALVAELREKVERLKAIIESIGKRAYTRGDRTFDDAIRDLSWIDDECRRARSELEGR